MFCSEDIVNSIYEKGYFIGENYFNEAKVMALLNIFEQQEFNLKAAAVGKNSERAIHAEIRSDKIVWIEEVGELNTLFFDFINELQLQLNRRCYLGLNNREFHFAKYDKNTFYKRHKDAFNNTSERKISLILYLNKNWKIGDGGELKIYLENKELTILPKAGTIVVFESFIEHEVLTSNTIRLSLAGWLKSIKI